MFSEDQLLPISALQHLIFCERQCALIHVERLWAENRSTIEGKHLHEKAHKESTRTEKGVRVARGLQIRSLQLGLIGQADVVEFHELDQGSGSDCAQHSPSRSGNRCLTPLFKVVPVEYKRGKPKKDDSDRVQLCAQALCLEEMLGVHISGGYLFYGKQKRRTEVHLDDGLRQRTASAIRRLHEMIDARETPAAVRMPKCDQCSLIELCLPDCFRYKTGAAAFTQRQLAVPDSADPPQTDPFSIW